MSISLVVSPKQLLKTVPTFNELMAGFSFAAGQRYNEFRSGDKVAEYGLTALVTGRRGGCRGQDRHVQVAVETVRRRCGGSGRRNQGDLQAKAGGVERLLTLPGRPSHRRGPTGGVEICSWPLVFCAAGSMGYLQDFFIAIAILYLIECVLAVRRDLIVFWSLGFGKSRVTRADNLPGSPTRGLFLAMPLPPLGRVFLAQFWPLSISPAGVANCRPHTLGVDIVQEPPPEFAGFDDMHQLDHDDEYIRINGRRFARAVDSAAAQDFVSIIGRVKQTPADRRQQVIEAAIAESLDAEAVRTELSRFDACSASVRLSCNALLVHLFVVCPLVARQLGLSGTWLYLSVAILVLWITAIICYYLAHRALCPAHAAERRRQAVIVALTPLAAIRAIDALSQTTPGSVSPSGHRGSLMWSVRVP